MLYIIVTVVEVFLSNGEVTLIYTIQVHVLTNFTCMGHYYERPYSYSYGTHGNSAKTHTHTIYAASTICSLTLLLDY